MADRTKWEVWYRALKAAHPNDYRKAIQYGEALAINWNLSTERAAEVERSHVMLACEVLGVQP